MGFEGKKGHFIEVVVDTVWKIRKFSATKILYEITFAIAMFSKSVKTENLHSYQNQMLISKKHEKVNFTQFSSKIGESKFS